MKTKLFIFFFCLPTLLLAQSANLSERITIIIERATIEEALNSIASVSEVKFAYSKDIIPMEAVVNVNVIEKPLAEVLDLLFEPTQIVYARIGNQVVLKIDEKKIPIPIGGNGNNERLSSREIQYEYPDAVYKAEEMKSDSPVQQQAKVLRNDRLPQTLPPKALIGSTDYEFKIDYSELDFQGYINLDNYKIPVVDAIREVDFEEVGDSIAAKVTETINKGKKIFEPEEKVVKRISFNPFFAKAKSVEGAQISGVVSFTERDLDGLQLSLVGGMVEGDVLGSQISGIYNYSEGDNFGTQISGIANVANTMIGLQLSGITNQANDTFKGTQISGIHNHAQNATGGLQISSIANSASGNINVQIGVINKAENVRGVQLGIINMADTIRGVPIGLFNFIKDGYNRLELKYGSDLTWNVGVKFGARSFYNMLEVGTQKELAWWGLGYGIGTYARLGKRAGLNIEVLAMHLNNNDNWVKKWNALGQFRTTLDIRLGKKFSLFAGPQLNVLYSENYDTDTGTFNTLAVDKTSYEETDIMIANPYLLKIWIGCSAGFRF